MITKTNKLTEVILLLLETRSRGPRESIGIIMEVIGILAVKCGDNNYPKESDCVFRHENETFRVETKVSRITN